MNLIHLVTKLFKSKTLIVNWAVLIGSVLTVITNSAAITAHPEVVAYLISALSGVNLFLRLATNKALGDK